MMAMLSSAPRLKKKIKDRVKRSRKRQAKRFALALRRSEIALRQAARAAGLWQPKVVEDLVVSLTSFPVRIGKLHLVIRGLLAQSLQPRKIVLYLSLDEFPDRTVPNELSALAGDRFEIRFVEGNLRPYKKLLYALTDFPGATIITVDDDNLHPADCLARLWKASAANPRTVICVRGRCMQIHDGAIAHYMDWRSHSIVQAELHDLPRRRLGHPLSPGIVASHDRPTRDAQRTGASRCMAQRG